MIMNTTTNENAQTEMYLACLPSDTRVPSTVVIINNKIQTTCNSNIPCDDNDLTGQVRYLVNRPMGLPMDYLPVNTICTAHCRLVCVDSCQVEVEWKDSDAEDKARLPQYLYVLLLLLCSWPNRPRKLAQRRLGRDDEYTGKPASPKSGQSRSHRAAHNSQAQVQSTPSAGIS